MPRGTLPISRQELATVLKIDPEAIHAIHADPEHDRIVLIMDHAKARKTSEHEHLAELTLRPESAAVLVPSGARKKHWWQKEPKDPKAPNSHQRSPATTWH
jgi:hypothetical protein